jgi:hypothetical protein
MTLRVSLATVQSRTPEPTRSQLPPSGTSRGDSALPADLLRRLREQTSGLGEPRLALAVLEEAIRCIERNHGAEQLLPRLFSLEAEQWVESQDCGQVFSFEIVCRTLGLDPAEVREQLGNWLKRHPDRRSPLRSA